MTNEIKNQNYRKEIRNIKINLTETARLCDCSIKTVKKKLTYETDKPPRKTKPKILEPFYSIVNDKIDKYAVTAYSVYLFIKELGYKGSYETVKNYVKLHKKKSYKETFIRVLRTPGLQAQVDWKESKKLITKYGELIEFNIFSYVLCYSQYRVYICTKDRSQPTLFKCLIESFKQTGGVPEEIWFDNMKTVVQKHDINTGHVIFQPDFNQFAKEAGFTPIACRPYRPQTKGLIEGAVKLTNRLDVYNDEIESYEDVEKLISKFNKKINDEINDFTNSTGNIMLKNEKEYLLPINNLENRFFIKTTDKRIVTNESMINYKNNKYSVPIECIGEEVIIEEKDNILYIYYNSNLIRMHELSDKKINYNKTDMKEILSHSINGNKYSEEELEKHVNERLKMYEKIQNNK